MEGIIQGTKTFNNSDLKLQHLTRRRTDIQGESTLFVGEQTVGETTGYPKRTLSIPFFSFIVTAVVVLIFPWIYFSPN